MITNEYYTCLVEKYIDTVYRIALSMTGRVCDAEDITQNTFLALLQNKKGFESEAHLKHWLIRVTVNGCKKLFRSLWRNTCSIDEIPIAFQSPEHSSLFDALKSLPFKYKAPIYLYYYEGYSTAEIAKILKIPKGTVCTHLDRGRQMLKNLLQEVDNDE